MATLAPYVAMNAAVGQKIAVKVKKFVWLTVGKGTVESFSDDEVDIAGKISFGGYNGDLKIHLKLKENVPQALSGPCCLQLNKYTDEDAKYKATKDKLTVFAVLGGKKQNITISQTNEGSQTECKLTGHVSETVHLDPS